MNTDQVLSILRRRIEGWRKIHDEIVPDAHLARTDALARVEAYEDCIDIITALIEQEREQDE